MAADLFVESHNNAVTELCEAAKLAPDLFDNKVVDLLELGASDESFASMSLPILACLARASPGVRDRIRPRLTDVIQFSIPIEVIADALDACFGENPRQMSDQIIDRLLAAPDYMLPIGGWGDDGEPTYPITFGLLVKLVDSDEQRLAAAFVARLGIDDKTIRANACRIIEELSSTRPTFGLTMLPHVIKSLELDDNAFAGTSADASAVSLTSTLLATRFDEAHTIVQGELRRLSVGAKAVTIGAYERLFRRGGDWREATHDGLDDEIVGSVVAYCCGLVTDAREEPAVRRAAAEAIQAACRAGVTRALDLFDQLLGSLALSLDVGRPPNPPRIILPGEEKTLAEHELLRQQQRDSEWDRFKREVLEIIKEIGKVRPSEVGAALIATFDAASAIGRSRLKNTALKLLGEAARHSQELCLLALPTFMAALADYSSHSTRSVAIGSIETAYSGAGLTLPSNVVDLIIVHLRDQYVVVHKAAIRFMTFSWVPMTAQQRLEAFGALAAIWRVYSQDPMEVFFMDDVADAMLSVAADNDQMRNIALRAVCAYLPTDEVLVDSKLCETLVRASNPGDQTGVIVARALIRCLTQHHRDGFGSGRDWREDAVDWLLELPGRAWRVVAPEFTACAAAVVQRDPAEAALFASALCEHGDHAEEAAVLLLGSCAAKGHSLYHGLSKPLEKLNRQALASQRGAEE